MEAARIASLAVFFFAPRGWAADARPVAVIQRVESNLDAEFDSPVKLGKKTAATCRQFLEALEAGARPTSADEAETAGQALKRCGGGRLVKTAKPSRKSGISTFRFSDKSFQEISPAIGRVSGDAAFEKRKADALAKGKSWADVAKPEALLNVRPHEFGFRLQGRDVLISLLAEGDFDGDGQEDALAYVTTRAVSGPYRACELVALTRAPGEKVLQRVSVAPLSLEFP